MSTQQALAFLQILRNDNALRASLALRQDEIGVGDLVTIGGACGFAFDEHQLREAFIADWGLLAVLNRRSRMPR